MEVPDVKKKRKTLTSCFFAFHPPGLRACEFAMQLDFKSEIWNIHLEELLSEVTVD